MSYNRKCQKAAEEFITALVGDEAPLQMMGHWAGWITYVLEGLDDIAGNKFEPWLADMVDNALAVRVHEGVW